MKRKVVSQRRAVRAQTKKLIASFADPAVDETLQLPELVTALPTIFESAVAYILSEFDYEANLHSNTAIAVRLLAVSAERFERIARTSA
jgi:hypothetical protein